MKDIDLDKTINAIGYQLCPRGSMGHSISSTFKEMVGDVTDGVVKINTLNALTTAYNNSQDANDKAFFRNEIDKLLNNGVASGGNNSA